MISHSALAARRLMRSFVKCSIGLKVKEDFLLRRFWRRSKRDLQVRESTPDTSNSNTLSLLYTAHIHHRHGRRHQPAVEMGGIRSIAHIDPEAIGLIGGGEIGRVIVCRVDTNHPPAAIPCYRSPIQYDGGYRIATGSSSFFAG